MNRFTAGSRGGTILICVLACLIIVTALIGSVTRTALRGRHAVRIQKQLRQTELLCEAGVLRAAQQLKRSADYEGEQWRPQLAIARPAERTQNGDEEAVAEATVDIRVTQTDNSSLRRVEVVAKLEGHVTSAGPLQRSHQFTVAISPTSSSEKQ